MPGSLLNTLQIRTHLNFPSHPVTKIQVLFSVLQMRNRGTERLSNLPEATQLVSGRAGIQTQTLGPMHMLVRGGFT